MIVLPICLVSGINGTVTDLGTLVIDNQGHPDKHPNYCCNYRCRMYRKGELTKHDGSASKLIREAKPFREGAVLGHNRQAEPVQNLVLKALQSLGYSE